MGGGSARRYARPQRRATAASAATTAPDSCTSTTAPTKQTGAGDGQSTRSQPLAGAAAFFGSVLAVGAFDLLDVDGLAEFFISVVVAVFTAGAVYAKERLGFAKKRAD